MISKWIVSLRTNTSCIFYLSPCVQCCAFLLKNTKATFPDKSSKCFQSILTARLAISGKQRKIAYILEAESLPMCSNKLIYFATREAAAGGGGEGRNCSCKTQSVFEDLKRKSNKSVFSKLVVVSKTHSLCMRGYINTPNRDRLCHRWTKCMY